MDKKVTHTDTGEKWRKKVIDRMEADEKKQVQ